MIGLIPSLNRAAEWNDRQPATINWQVAPEGASTSGMGSIYCLSQGREGYRSLRVSSRSWYRSYRLPVSVHVSPK